MSEKYLPSTPLEARVRAGHFGEANVGGENDSDNG